MRPEHLALLACPDCHGELTLRAKPVVASDHVVTGVAVCRLCASQYPIVRGVPRFVSSDNYARGFGFQWARHPRLQLDSYTGIGASRSRFFSESGWPCDMPGELILEVGSGAGRFTEQAARTRATVVSIDYSDAVDVNYSNHEALRNVLIVQADIYRLPIRPGSVDRVFCFGVLQHTPDPARAFRALPPCLKPGGSLAVDVYLKHRGVTRLFDTKYWVRPLTRRIPHRALYRLVSAYIHCVWPLASIVGRIPRVGVRINWKLLVSDCRVSLNLPDGLLEEWAILDTFDMLAPAYDSPQSVQDVRTWCESARLHDSRIAIADALVVARGSMARAAGSRAS